MSDRSSDGGRNEVADCIRKLCKKICPDKRIVESAYRMAVASMATVGQSPIGGSEDIICHRIQERLRKMRSARDADKFTEHYQQLRNSVVLKNRSGILTFLYSLSAPNYGDLATKQREALSSLSLARQGSAPACSPTEGPLRHSSSQPSIGFKGFQQLSSWPPGPPSSGELSHGSHNHTWRDNHRTKIPDDECDVSERELIQEVLYVAQGVGRWSRVSSREGRGRLGLAARVAELGFLHDKICAHMSPTSGCMPIGVVGQGLISAFHNELSEYYRSIAVVQTELNSSNPGQAGALTLRRLFMWSTEPLHRLKWLAIIGYASQNKKGGELASCVHRFLSHGDPRVTSLVHQLLATVCYPLYVMLCRWLLDGEIEDQFNEFFIEGRTSVTPERLWHDKYRVREAMLPAFISKRQAQDILATGKSVTFLREVCGDRGQLGEREALKRVLDSSSVELLFSGGPETKLHGVMSSAYLGVSRRLLDTLLGPHKLLQHLQALRGYLLLGQGDTIQNLMVLLEPELNKNASQLYVHNLTCILETAIRSTNAQYDDPDILNRLYVNLFPPSPEDSGWDVFSLFYRVEGPLGTVLQPEAAASYRTLFTHLWRAKRMEHTLAQMWRRHTVQYKTVAKMSELSGLLRRLHALRSEMVHLVKELQHALFVVVECAWQELQAGAKRAHALDQLLAAHTTFLAAVTAGALLDDQTKPLQTYLGNVYTEILSLRDFESKLYTRINEESDRRKAIRVLKDERGKKGEYGITKDEEIKNQEDLKLFLQYIVERKADLNVLSRTYRGHVKTFILKLALQNESSLQFLLYRLDYNDFYKRGDSKLHEPLTYQHKRLSEVGLGGKLQNGGHKRADQQMAAARTKEHRKHK